MPAKEEVIRPESNVFLSQMPWPWNLQRLLVLFGRLKRGRLVEWFNPIPDLKVQVEVKVEPYLGFSRSL